MSAIQIMENLIESSFVASPLISILMALFAGVLTSLTPCIYPMIPIVASTIGTMNKGSKKNALVLSLLYALGLSLVYAVLGLLATLGANIFGDVASALITNLLIGNIFLLFSFWMFGWLKIPQIGLFQQSDKPFGQYLSAFTIGASSGLVAAPCTAPVLGMMLTLVAAEQSYLAGFFMLLSFAFGMSILLIVVGTSTSLSKKLPRSGKWLNVAPRFFGLLMLIVAQYYLLKAGQQWF